MGDRRGRAARARARVARSRRARAFAPGIARSAGSKVLRAARKREAEAACSRSGPRRRSSDRDRLGRRDPRPAEVARGAPLGRRARLRAARTGPRRDAPCGRWTFSNDRPEARHLDAGRDAVEVALDRTRRARGPPRDRGAGGGGRAPRASGVVVDREARLAEATGSGTLGAPAPVPGAPPRSSRTSGTRSRRRAPRARSPRARRGSPPAARTCAGTATAARKHIAEEARASGPTRRVLARRDRREAVDLRQVLGDRAVRVVVDLAVRDAARRGPSSSTRSCGSMPPHRRAAAVEEARAPLGVPAAVVDPPPEVEDVPRHLEPRGRRLGPGAQPLEARAEPLVDAARRRRARGPSRSPRGAPRASSARRSRASRSRPPAPPPRARAPACRPGCPSRAAAPRRRTRRCAGTPRRRGPRPSR